TEDFVSYLLVAEPTRDPNNAGKPMGHDRLLNVSPQVPVSSKHQLKANSCSHENRSRTQKQHHSLTFIDTANADKTFAIIRHRTCGVHEIIINTTMDHFDLRPLRLFNPPKQLAARERAHRSNKRGATDLFGQPKILRPVELVAPMHCKAVA